MLDENNVFSFEDFLAANKDKKLVATDYIHAIFTLSGLPIDLAFCFIELFIPKIKIVDGLAFIKDSFDIDVYHKYLSDGKSKSEAQLWMNLIEITGVFPEVSGSDGVKLANHVAYMWNLHLKNETVQSAGKARIIHDNDTGEVFVTIDQLVQ